MEKVYVLSGLGVDKRVFNNFKFDNLDVEFIDWIHPLEKESLSAYARRLANKIQHKDTILIGLSFGGMVAMEIAKIIEVKKVILIASAKNKHELPFYYKAIGKIELNKVIPAKLLKSSNYITNWFFGVQTKEEKLLLKNILQDTDSIFLKWAIHEILSWDNTVEPVNTIHVHGNSDRILPIRYVDADYLVNQGGHFMTINKAKEIEEIIKQIIKNTEKNAMQEKWTMFSTPKEELKQLLISLGTCSVEKDFIQVKDYPFEPSIAYNQTTFKKEDIVDIDCDSQPMTIRIKDELIFVSVEHKEDLMHFAFKNKIKIVQRPAIWDLILKPFLDTEFTEDNNKRTTQLLIKYGLTPEQINQLRDEVEIQMLKYNFDTTLWEWCNFDASDVLKAIRPKYNKTDFRVFYKKVMEIALLQTDKNNSI